MTWEWNLLHRHNGRIVRLLLLLDVSLVDQFICEHLIHLVPPLLHFIRLKLGRIEPHLSLDVSLVLVEGLVVFIAHHSFRVRNSECYLGSGVVHFYQMQIILSGSSCNNS